MADIYRIVSAPPGELQDQANELSGKYQALSFTVSAISDRVVVTAIMVAKSELAAPRAGLSIAGNGAPPFGR